MTAIDLGPAAQQVIKLIEPIPDEALGTPTPSATTLGDLLDHIDALSLAFTAAAAKTFEPGKTERPSPDASHLGDDWRARIPDRLTALAEAWRDPAAWQGLTEAGGIEMPGEVAAVVALDELVIHGWDLARSTGQPFDCDAESLRAVHGFVVQFSGPGMESQREGLFGPVVDVPDDAPLLDRVLGLTGRDPAWSPS